MRPLRAGVVGAGIFGVNHLNAFRQLSYTGAAELAAVAEIDEERARWVEQNYQVPVFRNYEQLLALPDIDIVTVATPDFAHREIVVAAAQSGKHILCEKPLATTVEDCQAMVESARKAKVLLQVDFHKRFDPEHIAIMQRISSGEFGEILYGSVTMEDRIEVPVDWFPHWAHLSSPGWFLAVHFVDLVRWMIRSDGKSVYAHGRREVLKNSYNIDTWDSLSAVVEFQNGAVFTFNVSWILPRTFEAIVNQDLRIVGAKGAWEIDTQFRGSRSCHQDEGMRTPNNNFISEARDKQGRTIYKGYGIEAIEDIVWNVRALQQGASLEELAGTYPSGEDGLEATRIVSAIHESAETHRVIEISR